jgi:hypothetical protein
MLRHGQTFELPGKFLVANGIVIPLQPWPPTASTPTTASACPPTAASRTGSYRRTSIIVRRQTFARITGEAWPTGGTWWRAMRSATTVIITKAVGLSLCLFNRN